MSTVWVTPPGGWKVNTEKGIEIRGVSYPDLIKNFIAHHKSNGQPQKTDLQYEEEVKAKLPFRPATGNIMHVVK